MNTDYREICIRSLQWARSDNYTGYSKFDALNSPVLRFLGSKSRFLRGGFVFALSRTPLNVRGLLGVQKKQNPKGLALFARTCFNLYKTTQDESFRDEGLELLGVLLGISRRKDYSGHCW
ncbi:MAG: hypothetical protein KAR47_05775, partial [Planctomycetes bacterium]|nr:hypothetical protein [Planctomycetota bacterium]